MKKGRWAYFSIALILLAIFLYWKSHSVSYHVPLTVLFDQSDFPIVEAKIEEKIYPLKVHLGSKFELALEPDALASFAPIKTVSYLDEKGKRHECPEYNLSNLSLDSLKFCNLSVIEHSNGVGSIGRPLLSKMNLLFDFNNSLIIASNSFRQLKEDGYDLSTYLKVPLEITSKGIFLKIETDFGVQNFFLNTGASRTALKKPSLSKASAITSERFVIQKHNFGPINLSLLEIPDALENVEGFLGVDFFKKHIIYLDWSKRYAYIQPTPHSNP